MESSDPVSPRGNVQFRIICAKFKCWSCGLIWMTLYGTSIHSAPLGLYLFIYLFSHLKCGIGVLGFHDPWHPHLTPCSCSC